VAAQPRRILVGLDGSAAGWRALEAAIQLTGYGSTLTVIHVLPEGEPSDGLLQKARKRVRSRQLTATYVERVGDPAEQLLEAARELDSELLVVGRRAEHVDRSPPGSVSAAVVNDAPCDVLVIS
jgi:nucleotide-binding universal stress UspA family protein